MPGVQQLVADADVVLAVGTEFGETDFYYALKLDAARPADSHRHRSAQALRITTRPSCRSGAMRSASLAALLQALPSRARPTAAAAAPRGGLRAEIEGTLDAKARGWQSALEAIRAALPRDGAVFTDMTQIAYFGNYAFPVDAPAALVSPVGLRHLGLCVARRNRRQDLESGARRSLALAGDFGLQFTLGELMTAVEAGAEPAA